MSTAARVTLEPAWLLHVRPWRDTSVLIEAFTRDHGRVGLVGRGVRGPRGRWRGLLQPLQPLLVSWSGRGELVGLNACEPAGPAVVLRDEPLMSAWYLNELLMRLLQRHDAHPQLFAAYGEALAALHEQAGVALRLFEKRLLDALGWGAAYDQAADNGSPVVASARYGFSADRGVLALGGGDLEVDGRTLLALAAERFPDDQTAIAARSVLRLALAPHLGGRPLHSRELLKAWRAQRGMMARDG